MDMANSPLASEDGQASNPVARWLKDSARLYGTRAALTGTGAGTDTETLSFEDLQRRSTAFADGLRSLGLQHGDAIAIWLPNRPSWMLIHFAAARLGLLTVPINTWCRESEITHLLTLGRCRAICIDSAFRSIDFLQILTSALDKMTVGGDVMLRWVIDAGETRAPSRVEGSVTHLSLNHLENAGVPALSSPLVDDSVAIVFSTSGTSSLPKLAGHTGRALVAHAQAVARCADMTDADVVLGVLPPCGAYGYGLVMAAVTAGARAVLMEEFDLDRCVESIATERVTMMAVTEPLLRKLLNHPRASREAFASLRIVFSAGGTLLPAVEKAAQFGFRVTNVYGSSEILALAAFWGFDLGNAGRSAAGGALVSDGMQVRVVDGQGTELAPGAEGELQFRGPIVTSGYLANPKAHRRRIHIGWLVQVPGSRPHRRCRGTNVSLYSAPHGRPANQRVLGQPGRNRGDASAASQGGGGTSRRNPRWPGGGTGRSVRGVASGCTGRG